MFVLCVSSFWQGDQLSIKVNKLSSTKTQLPYDYYYLKYCKPKQIENSAENLGEVLRGDRIENSVYAVSTYNTFALLPIQLVHTYLKNNVNLVYLTSFFLATYLTSFLNLYLLIFFPVQNEGGAILCSSLSSKAWCWICKKF